MHTQFLWAKSLGKDSLEKLRRKCERTALNGSQRDRIRTMKQMVDGFCISGVETLGSGTAAFVNMGEEGKNMCRL
jgi:hypothetical protein